MTQKKRHDFPVPQFSCSPKFHTNKILKIKFCSAQYGSIIDNDSQPFLGQVRMVRLGWLDQVRISQVWLGQVRLGQVRLGQVRLVRLGQVRLGQIRLGQVRLVRLGQVRLGQVKLIGSIVDNDPQPFLGQATMVRLGQVGQIRLGQVW